MLRDRYPDDDIPGGLLYYMKTGHMQGLPAETHEIRSKGKGEGGRGGGGGTGINNSRASSPK